MSSIDLKFSRAFSGSKNLRFGNVNAVSGLIDAAVDLVSAINSETYPPIFDGFVSGTITVSPSISANHIPHIGVIDSAIRLNPSIIGFLPVYASSDNTLAIYSAVYGNQGRIGTINSIIDISSNVIGKGNDWNFVGNLNGLIGVSGQFSSVHGVGGLLSSRMLIGTNISAVRGIRSEINAKIQGIESSISAWRGNKASISESAGAIGAVFLAKTWPQASISAFVPVIPIFEAERHIQVIGNIGATILVGASMEVRNAEPLPRQHAFAMARKSMVFCRGCHV